MTKPLLLHCLHGFLGRPDLWNEVMPVGSEFIAHDLLEMGAGARRLTIEQMGARLNEYAHVDRGHSHALVGYSMGGRIALHALAGDPSLWQAAVIVSANSGVAPAERATRLERDQAIAARFVVEPWDALLASWDAQSVFCGRKPTQSREEGLYSRSALAYALEAWSVARQRDLKPLLLGLRVPMLWLSGVEDKKYTELAREAAALSPAFRFACLEGAAHRVPWEAPEAFKNSVSRFLSELKLTKE